MFITPSFKKSLVVEQFQGNYLKFRHVAQNQRHADSCHNSTVYRLVRMIEYMLLGI